MIYLVTPVYVDDEYVEPHPSFAVIPVTKEYIESLIEKFNRVRLVEDLFYGAFQDYSVTYIEHPWDFLTDDLHAELDGDETFLTDSDLSDETLERLDLIVASEVPTVQFYQSSKPECAFYAYIKHTGVTISTDTIDLEWVLAELEKLEKVGVGQ